MPSDEQKPSADEVDLQDLGWSEFVQEGWITAQEQFHGVQPARVAVEEKHGYRIVGRQGETFAKCSPNMLRRRRTDSDLPKVGDWVVFLPTSPPSPAVIQAILSRKTHLTRKVPGRQTREQILATNVDLAFIVQGLDQVFNARRMERFIVMAHDGGVKPVIVLNKIDLCDHLDEAVEAAKLVAAGAPVHAVSGKTRKGIKALRALIAPGLTSVFVGISGAGKSTLINALAGEQLQETLEVRERDFKGRHTTTAREMLLLPGGGLVIDTPGLRELHLLATGAGLADAFPEIIELSARCKFRDCSHRSEPECAVKQALVAGTLHDSRYQAYLKLRQELEQTAAQSHHSTGLKSDRDPGHSVAATRANRKRKRDA